MLIRKPTAAARPGDDDPQLEAKLAHLVDCLTDPDEGLRQYAVQAVRQACRTGGLGEVAARLVEVVCQCGAAAAQRAAASLAGLGPAAWWPTAHRLLHSRSPRPQLRLVRVLEALAPELGADACRDLLMLLAPLRLGTPDPGLGAALGGLLGRLRARLEGAAPSPDGPAAPARAMK
jgi:hypothetical protein